MPTPPPGAAPDLSADPNNPSGGDPTQDQSIMLSPDQLNAAGMAGASAGQSWTLTGTIQTVDDSGATFSVDHAQQEGGDPNAASDGAGDQAPKLRKSMTPVGPGQY